MNDKRRPQPTKTPQATNEDPLSDITEAQERADETDDETDDEDEDEFVPRVVVGRLRDLGPAVDAALLKQYGDRPLWFMIEDDDEYMELFDRLPENPMPNRIQQAILSVIRQFAASHSDALQEILGPTEAIGLGFHASATIDSVIESFEDDGFEVCLALVNGNVEFEEEAE